MPAIQLPLELVVMFGRSKVDESESGKGRVQLLLSGRDNMALSDDIEIDLREAHRHRFRLILSGLPIIGQGIYRFAIEAASENREWQQLFEVPLEVSYQE